MIGLTNVASENSAVIGLVVPAISEAVGTFVYDETSALEQTCVTVTIAARSMVSSVWLDMVNVTQNTTIKLYHQIDGTNYREFQSTAWVVADADGVLLHAGFAAYRNIRVTLQCAGGGAGNVNVLYRVL